MTQTEKSSRKVINGAGWANPLTHDYRVDLAAHVHVFADTVELVNGVDYTVTNIGVDAGYAVTIAVPGSWAPTKWILDARPSIDQGADISLGGQFGAAYEDAADKLTRRVQRIYDLARRGLKTSLSTAVADNPYTLPAPTANQFLRWNAAGTDLENGDIALLGGVGVSDDAALADASHVDVPSEYAVKTYVDTGDAALLSALNAGLALKLAKASNLSDVADKVTSLGNLNYQRAVNATYATRTAIAKMSDYVDLRDWAGLDLTGATDMAAIVQAAVNTAAAAGAVLRVPAGKIRLDSTITVPAGAVIQGPGLPSDRNGAFSAYHCYFYLNHLGVGFNLTGTGTGRRLAGFGTYRNQPVAGGGWTPVAASYDIQVFGVYDAIIEDIFLYNATRGILVTGDTVTPAGNGRLTIQNIRGQCMSFGLVMTHVYDVCYIDNIHFWPFWSFDANITGYQKANGTAFLFKRLDNTDIGRLFQYGMQTGLTIDQQASVGLDGTLPPGSVSLLHIDAFGSDNCRIGMNVASGAAATFAIDEFYAVNSTAENFNLIDIAGSNTKGSIKNIFGARTNQSLISLNTGTGIELTVGPCRSLAIDNDANGTPEFNVATGNKLTFTVPPVTTAGTVYSSTGDIFPRGTIPDRQIATVTGSTVALNNGVTTQQNIFAAANDTLTLLGGTLYRFRAKIGLNTGAVSHATRFSITGTATFTDIDYHAITANGPAGTPNAMTLRRVETAAQSTVVAANTNVTTDIWIEGTFRTNAAGTIVPQIDFTVAPTGTCEVTIGSFFEVEKIGPASAAALGNWS